MRLKNIKNNKIFDKILVPNKLFIVMFILLNVIILYNTYLTKNRIDSYFRVHIVANSNSIEDQLLKYNIADKVDKYLLTLTNNKQYSKEDIKNLIDNNIQNILNICEQTITNNGYIYNVCANIGKIYYDEKQKDNIYMNAGIYDSLQIIIGEGKGENWWSLVFPYAFDGVITNNNEILKGDTHIKTDDTNHISIYDIVSSDTITVKFGVLELLSKIFN